ncbi:MAG: cytochrome c [Nitrospinae bacterium]|nr:cytochrome c [Nitrospinota bacterium]
MITNRYAAPIIAVAYAILLTISMSTFADEPKSWNNGDGAKLYLEYCSMCHGDKGQGIPPLPPGAVSLIPPAPPLNGGAVTTKSRSLMVDYIRNGGAGRGGVMEGFHETMEGKG